MSLFSRDLLAKAFPNDPRLRAQFEDLDSFFTQAQEQVTALLASASDAASRLTNLEGTATQPLNGWLTAISDLPDVAGAMEITGPDAVTVRGIDSTDSASLLSRGVADLRYSPIGGGAHVADANYGDITVSGTGTVWTINVGAVSAAEVSGLGYFATGTDAANLTGTVAAARIADGSLSIAKTSGLQTALDGKLTIADGAGSFTGYKQADVEGGVVYHGPTSDVYAGVFTDLDVGYFYGQNTDGSLWQAIGGSLNANSRFDVTGSNAFEFSDTPYVGTNAMLTAASTLDATKLTGTIAAGRLPAFSGGDVTSSAGSAVLTIGAGKVTLAQMANMATASLIYRKTAGAGAPEVNTLATLKTDLGLTGTNSGDQFTAMTSSRFLGRVTAGFGAAEELTAAQAKTLLAIGESDVTNLTTDLAAKAPLASPQFTGVSYYQQSSPTARNSTTTLTIADLLTLIITSTSTTAVSLTLPTGTLTDAGILSGALAVNEAFEWYLINLGSASGAVTIVAGVGHTIVGSATVAISTSARFLTRKTAANTFVTYRIA